MIEGLKVDISASEISAHLKVRIEHHTAKAKDYRHQADEVKKLQEAGDIGIVNASASVGDPVVALQQSAAQHERTAEAFALFDKYLVAGETYRLTESDLSRLELMRRL